jgi:hypothetical protein
MTVEAFGQITPDLLQALLEPKFPRLRVHAVQIDGAIHGTATKVKVRLDAEGEGPRTMWVKAGWEDSSEILRKVGIFSREPRVYAELLPDLGLEVPDCYGATWDDDRLDGVLLLEDLADREALFHSPLDALSPNSVAVMLAQLAQMHATTHGSKWLDAHDWLRPLFWDVLEPGSYLTHVSAPDTLEQFLALPRGLSLPEAARDAQRISKAMRRTAAFGMEDAERCMIHGDAHVGNSYSLPDGALGLLDWQCVWRGSWAFDVAYFIASSLSPEDRRKHEVELLQHYLEERARHGWPGPSMAHAFDRYRRYLAYGLTVWLTNLPSFQPEEFNAVVASRFAHAMLDHGLFDA